MKIMKDIYRVIILLLAIIIFLLYILVIIAIIPVFIIYIVLGLANIGLNKINNYVENKR